MLVLQITGTDGIHDSIVINKPQIFTSYADPDFMDYITSKIHRERNPPDMSEWTLESTTRRGETSLSGLEVEDTPVVKKKRGRPKGSRKKVKVPYVEEDFMDTTE